MLYYGETFFIFNFDNDIEKYKKDVSFIFFLGNILLINKFKYVKFKQIIANLKNIIYKLNIAKPILNKI